MRGDYTLAAEVLARALAQEGLRINHHLLPSATDLVSEPERYAVISKSLAVAMAHMREDLRGLKAPLLQREQPLLEQLLDAVEREAQRVRCLPGAWLRALRAADELPRPARALDLLARRWQLPSALVGGYWTDFTAASGGLYTLSLARAKLTLLSELADAELQQATWALLVLDPASSQLIELDESGAEPSGAGGASFEEYLIFRRFLTRTRTRTRTRTLTLTLTLTLTRFAEAPTLEQQFRFLWRLYDRDGDGLLGWADLLAALQLQRWRHGWSEAYTYQWAEYVWGIVPRRDRTTAYVGAITADELRSALRSWTELRLLLLARAPDRGRDRAARKRGSILALLGFSPRSAAAQPKPAARAPAPALPEEPTRHASSRVEVEMATRSRAGERSVAAAPLAGSTRHGSVAAATMSADEFF